MLEETKIEILNQNELTYILQNPHAISKEQTEALNTVLEEYPYFQSVRAVYLKGLKNQNSYKYNQELKTTAAYTTDRSILFDFITSETFLQNEISQNIKQNLQYLKGIEVNVEDISVNKSVQIDDALRAQIKGTSGVLDPELFRPKTTVEETQEISQIEEKQELVSAHEILNLGKPLEFDKSETHSFNEWLKLTCFKPIDRSDEKQDNEVVSKNEETRSRKYELIDKFISNKPKISPEKEISNSGNLAIDRMIQPEALMTETLARIYVEQKNYEKAIQAYKILSLKYPEKSGFFADQIKAVKKLQE